MSIHPTKQKLVVTIAEWEKLAATAGSPSMTLVEDTVALLRGYLYMANAVQQCKVTMAIFIDHYDDIFGEEEDGP